MAKAQAPQRLSSSQLSSLARSGQTGSSVIQQAAKTVQAAPVQRVVPAPQPQTPAPVRYTQVYTAPVQSASPYLTGRVSTPPPQPIVIEIPTRPEPQIFPSPAPVEKPLVSPTRGQIKTPEQISQETIEFRTGEAPYTSLADISLGRIQAGEIFGPTEQFSRGGVPISGTELSAIERVRQEQDVARVANLLQAQKVQAIRKAPSGTQVLQQKQDTELAGTQQIIEPQFTFGSYQAPSEVPFFEERPRIGGVSTPEQLAAIEKRLAETPEPSLQETLGFGIPQKKVVTTTEPQILSQPQEPKLSSLIEPVQSGTAEKLKQFGFDVNPEFLKGTSSGILSFEPQGKIAEPVPVTMETVSRREKLLQGATLGERQQFGLLQAETQPGGIPKSTIPILSKEEAQARDVFGTSSLLKPAASLFEGSLLPPLGIAKNIEQATGIQIVPKQVSSFFGDIGGAFTADIENEAIAIANTEKIASGQSLLEYNKTPQERVFGGSIENAFGSVFPTPLISEPDKQGMVDAQLASGIIVKVSPQKAKELADQGKLATVGGQGLGQFKATESQIFNNELTSFLQRPGLAIGSGAEFVGSAIIGGKAVSLAAKGVSKGIKALRGIPAAESVIRASEKPFAPISEQFIQTEEPTSSITGKILRGFGTVSEKISKTKQKITEVSPLTGQPVSTAREISTIVGKKESDDLIKFNAQRGIKISRSDAVKLIIETRKKKIPLGEFLKKSGKEVTVTENTLNEIRQKELQGETLTRFERGQLDASEGSKSITEKFPELGFKVEKNIFGKPKIVPDSAIKQRETFLSELSKQQIRASEQAGKNILSPEQTAESVAKAASKAGGRGGKSAQELAEEFYAQQGKSEFIPTYLRRELSKGGEGEFGRVPGTFGSQGILSAEEKASSATTNELLNIRIKELTGEPLTKFEQIAVESAGRESVKKTATQEAGRVGGIISEGRIIRFGQGTEEGLQGGAKVSPKGGGGAGFGEVRKITKQQIQNFAKKQGISKTNAETILTKQAEREAGRTTGTVEDIFGRQPDTSARSLMQYQRGILDEGTYRDLISGGRQAVEETGPKTETLLTKSGRLRSVSTETEIRLTPKGTLKEVPIDDLSRITNVGGRFKRVGSEATDDLSRLSRLTDESLLGGRGRGGTILEQLGEETGRQSEKRAGRTASQVFEDISESGTKVTREGEFGPILKTVKPKGGIKPPSNLEKILAGGASKIPLGLSEGNIFGTREREGIYGIVGPKIGQEISQIPASIQDIFGGGKQKTRPQVTQTQFFEQPQRQRGRLKQPSPQTPSQRQTFDQYFVPQQGFQYPEPGKPGEPTGRQRGGFFFGGGGEASGESSSSSRKFFRVFDVAKTPFGRVERGLGLQVQSDIPIYEIQDVLGPKRKGSKPLQESYFDIGL